jgi:hypothetical protein
MERFMIRRINAQATVERRLKDGMFVVSVWSDQINRSKTMVVDAADEDAAAFLAIERFVEDFQEEEPG